MMFFRVKNTAMSQSQSQTQAPSSSFLTTTIIILGLWCGLVFISSSIIFVHAEHREIFSSATELERLFKHETEVVEKLEEYASALEKDLRVIKRYINDFNIIKKEDNPSQVVANPFNAYHILKRTTVDWEDVLNSIKNQTITDDLVGEVLKKSEKLPTFEDFIGGSMALVDLQNVYRFNLTDVINGEIGQGIDTSPYQLSARDCLFLGKAAFNKGLYDSAVSWLESALLRAEEEETTLGPNDVTASKSEILPFLKTTRRVHDEVLEKRGPIGDNWQTFPTPLNPKLAEKKKYQGVKAYKPIIYTPISVSEEMENFKSLCRDEELRTPKHDAPLRCRYRGKRGVSILAPFKVEEKSLEPYVIVVYDFMNEHEMNVYRDIGASRLQRSLHQGKNGFYVASDVRTSKQAWLEVGDDPVVVPITKRIGELSGLQTYPENAASEVFQVANYGVAGKYTPHTDYITGGDEKLNAFERRRGNRISTLMVYLDNVKAGGSTVFPLIGVKVKPVRGMAVFWWNLRRSGDGDPLTRHGGCPVVAGQKWITNKWIRYNSQFRTVKCVPEGDAFIQEL